MNFKGSSNEVRVFQYIARNAAQEVLGYKNYPTLIKRELKKKKKRIDNRQKCTYAALIGNNLIQLQARAVVRAIIQTRDPMTLPLLLRLLTCRGQNVDSQSFLLTFLSIKQYIGIISSQGKQPMGSTTLHFHRLFIWQEL